MRKTAVKLTSLLIVALWASIAAAYTNISPEELKSLLADPKEKANIVLVDLRTDKEFADGHVEGAVNIPFVFERTPGDKSTRYPNPEFKSQLQKLTADSAGKKFCLICATSHRTEQAANALAADPAFTGMTIVNVFGGMKGRPGVAGLKEVVSVVK